MHRHPNRPSSLSLMIDWCHTTHTRPPRVDLWVEAAEDMSHPPGGGQGGGSAQPLAPIQNHLLGAPVLSVNIFQIFFPLLSICHPTPVPLQQPPFSPPGFLSLPPRQPEGVLCNEFALQWLPMVCWVKFNPRDSEWYIPCPHSSLLPLLPLSLPSVTQVASHLLYRVHHFSGRPVPLQAS